MSTTANPGGNRPFPRDSPSHLEFDYTDSMSASFYTPWTSTRRLMPIHSTFGNGTHRCPGSNLGRTELKIFLQEWLPHPDFRHDPNDKVGMSSGVNATVYRLPLVWEVA